MMTKEQENEVMKRIKDQMSRGEAYHLGENYQANRIYLWSNGAWEERFNNEYGRSYGGMYSGIISVDDLGIQFDYEHTIIDLYEDRD